VAGEKSEQPSAKKVRKAREDGNVPKSKDFSSAIVFLIGAAVLGWAGPAGVDLVKALAVRCFSVGFESAGRLDALVVEMAREGMIMILIVCAPLMGAVFFSSLALGFGITGGLFTLKTLKFKFDKLNVFNGIKNNFFSARSYVELLKSLAKLTIAGYLGYGVIFDAIREVTQAHKLSPEQSVQITATLVGQLIKKIGGFMVVIGVFDLVYQRHTWWKGLMMSKQELKDEYKQAEGDPQMKGKRKQLAKEMANQKGVKAVRKAKVVVTNPHEIAVALEYEPEEGMQAPQILCKGERLIARQILEEAEKHGIPIMQNIALAHSLNELDAGDEVSEELYEAVAEVLNWVYALVAGDELSEEGDWGEEGEEGGADW
jgi:flagellar biosynthesis protein FlhB